MLSAITGVGTANPIYKRKQSETAELILASLSLTTAEKRLLRAIYKASGIEQRHSVLPDYCRNAGEFEFFPNNPDAPFPTTAARMQIYRNNALDLATKAINNCLNNKTNLSEITHLITVSCTGMYAPGLDIEIVKSLNLNTTIKRTCVNFMGCYGVFNALKLADSICKAEQAKVLIVSVELCTLHFQKNFSLDNIISNSLFADGAAAALVETNPVGNGLQLEHFYCDLIPDSTQEMAWTIADHGFDIVLSSYVPMAIKTGIASFFEKISHEFVNTTIDYFAIHPGGVKILEACEEALSLSKNVNRYAYHVLKNYGNMSSATILFLLKEIWQVLEQNRESKSIFACAFGPGLTLESLLLKFVPYTN